MILFKKPYLSYFIISLFSHVLKINRGAFNLLNALISLILILRFKILDKVDVVKNACQIIMVLELAIVVFKLPKFADISYSVVFIRWIENFDQWDHNVIIWVI